MLCMNFKLKLNSTAIERENNDLVCLTKFEFVSIAVYLCLRYNFAKYEVH